MRRIFAQEYQAVKSFLQDYFEILVILCLSTFFLVMQWYRPIGPTQAFNHFFYYFLFPILVIVLVLKEKPLDYGLRIGNFSVWFYYVLVTILVSFPILFISSKWISITHFYNKPLDYREFFILTIPSLFAWEYLLRGFVLFGLKKRYGASSIIIQMVPFVLLHLGKPEAEALSCILTGLWFGWIAYRGNSFWPAFIIHVYINFAVKYFVTF